MVRLRLSLSLIALLSAGCADEENSAISDAGLPFEQPRSGAWPIGCTVLDSEYLPRTLECTGLYRGGLTDKQIADDVRGFAPAVALWSDGADKERWIYLPPSTAIDTSNPAEWTFPVGTKLWKEFRKAGRRVETRLFYKVSEDEWKRGTYVWRDNETSATLWEDRTGVPNLIPLADGTDYLLPTRVECNECHKGRKDKVLGFETILLGMRGAEGLTLSKLVAEKRLSHPPARLDYQIPDDGTGVGAEALGYLHVNCGISCHNENSTALGYPTGMFLRLDPARLDGPQGEWNSVRTTKNVPAHIANFAGEVRIVPGMPSESLIVDVARTRGTNRQMPPIATRVVDQRGVVLITDWIARMLGAGKAPDAATPPIVPGGLDAGVPPVI